MAATLRSKFLSAEEQLLSAFSMGPDALSGFVDAWTALVAEQASAAKSHSLDSETDTLVRATASRIAILADTLNSLHLEGENAFAELQANVDGILKEQPASVRHRSTSPIDTSFPPRADDPIDEFSSFNAFASHWLLHNLHDPYPSSDNKSYMATRWGLTAKDVQAWFADARQRIGWTVLSREKFGGSRRETSDAAYRAYTSDSICHDLPRATFNAFLAIKANARDLYSDVHPHPPLQACPPTRHSDPAATSNEPRSYPSNIASGFLSSWITQPDVSACVDDEDDMTPPPPIAGCKRSSQTLNPSVEDRPGHDVRPRKRQCCTSTTSDFGAHVYEVNPDTQVSTTDHVLTEFRPELAHGVIPNYSDLPRSSEHIAVDADDNAMVPVSSPAPTSRKRRLSDTSLFIAPKRPRSLASGIRKQTVSDSIFNPLRPESADILGWDHVLPFECDTPQGIHVSGSYPPNEVGVTTHTTVPQSFPSAAPVVSNLLESNDTPSVVIPAASELCIADADLMSGIFGGFDLSTFDFWDSVPMPGSISDPADASTSFPLFSSTSVSPSSEFSDFGLLDNCPPTGSTQDWDQFLNIFHLASPTSSQSSLSDYSTSSGCTSNAASSPSHDDTTHSLFDVEPHFTPSDLLSEIGGLTSLSLPLNVVL